MLTEVPAGRELSDVYLRHPANESSSDSEGEEAPFTSMFIILKIDGVIKLFFLVEDDEEEAETFRRVVQQQRDMQVKRAKEAEAKKNENTTT